MILDVYKRQQLILKDFGIDVSETELVQAANANGWYNGGGTSPEDVGNLLNLCLLYTSWCSTLPETSVY